MRSTKCPIHEMSIHELGHTKCPFHEVGARSGQHEVDFHEVGKTLCYALKSNNKDKTCDVTR